MKNIISFGESLMINFTCGKCRTVYESNEHKKIELPGRNQEEIITKYFDRCANCNYITTVLVSPK